MIIVGAKGTRSSAADRALMLTDRALMLTVMISA